MKFDSFRRFISSCNCINLPVSTNTIISYPPFRHYHLPLSPFSHPPTPRRRRPRNPHPSQSPTPSNPSHSTRFRRLPLHRSIILTIRRPKINIPITRPHGRPSSSTCRPHARHALPPQHDSESHGSTYTTFHKLGG